MRLRAWILLASLCASPAMASDQIEMGAVPGWVRATAIPAPSDTVQGPISYLLLDEQLRLELGRLSSYRETAIRIETTEGLDAGNISLSWQPETQTITVHRLTLQRGGRTIDLLGTGYRFTVLRREANLESAMLDGQLTANIQPEGLQVGDIINLATTTSFADPTYRGHVEHRLDADYRTTIQRQHLSAQWPASLPVQLRQTPGLPTLKSRRNGDLLSVDLTIDKLEPGVTTRNAPRRYQRDRLIELSDFRSWSEVAALFIPLYDRAATLAVDSPLQAEIATIQASASTPKARAEAALALVQNRVRYVALLMGDGNFVPADATQTWNRRFGDCKAKSALLLAMLRGLGITADAVLVNVDNGDGMDERLPMVSLFNHVIVRATIDGKAYWLDGTRTGDSRLDRIDTPDFGWGLPLVADATLVRLVPAQPEQPLSDRVLKIDARQGISLPAPAEFEAIYRGDAAYNLYIASTNVTPADRERRQRDFWKKDYPFLTIKSVSGTYDPDRREYRLLMKGDATLDWEDGVYWLSDVDLGDSSVTFEREEKEHQTAPFPVNFPYFHRSTQTILLPPGVVPDDANVDTTAGGVHYKRKASVVGDVYTIETSTRTIAAEFPAAEAASAQKTIRGLAKTYVGLRVTSNYEHTEAEATAKLSKKAGSAEELVEQGLILIDRKDYKTAIARFDQALALAPQNGDALAGRAVARGWLGEPTAATQDLDMIERIDPDHRMLVHARAILAHLAGRWEEAIRYYGKLIEAAPEDNALLTKRAHLQVKLKRYPEALEDAARALAIDPTDIGLHGFRAQIFLRMTKPEMALLEADKLLAAHPNDNEALSMAAAIQDHSGRRETALRTLSQGTDTDRPADILIERSHYRPWADTAGRASDIAKALRLAPTSVEVIVAHVILQRRMGDFAGAAATLAAALKAHPNDASLIALHAQAKWLNGNLSEARKAFSAARAVANDETDSTRLCWYRAIADIDLNEALADCDTALAKDAESTAALETRGFTLVKLGRYDEALLAYDRALALDPVMGEAILGRAIAWKRKGDQAKADAYLAEVIAVDPDIVTEYRSYGMAF